MRKVFNLENVKVYTDDDDERKFVGYASTFGNEDRVGDVVEKGAFNKSLNRHTREKTMPAMLLHHDLHRPIGRWTTMSEDEKGLYVEGTLTKGVRDADEAYALLQDGAINSMSIGYYVNDEEWDSKARVNRLKEIELHEVSLVTIPANSAALVTSVKDADGEVNVRDLERALRDAGLSRNEAKKLIAKGFKALTEDEEETKEETDLQARDAAAQAESERLKAMLTRLASIK
jgi:hypothetical protein